MLTPPEQSLLSKLSTRPLAGFEFTPEERQLVSRLVSYFYIEDHGRAFDKYNWDDSPVAPTLRYYRSIFRLSPKGKAALLATALSIFPLIAVGADLPSTTSGSDSAPKTYDQLKLENDALQWEEDFYRSQSDNFLKLLGQTQANIKVQNTKIENLNKQIEVYKKQIENLKPSNTTSMGAPPAASTAPHKTDSPPMSHPNPPLPAKSPPPAGHNGTNSPAPSK